MEREEFLGKGGAKITSHKQRYRDLYVAEKPGNTVELLEEDSKKQELRSDPPKQIRGMKKKADKFNGYPNMSYVWKIIKSVLIFVKFLFNSSKM